jgi:hypothetical protein
VRAAGCEPRDYKPIRVSQMSFGQIESPFYSEGWNAEEKRDGKLRLDTHMSRIVQECNQRK